MNAWRFLDKGDGLESEAIRCGRQDGSDGVPGGGDMPRSRRARRPDAPVPAASAPELQRDPRHQKEQQHAEL
ncbi:MAG TPA: hypothetical protein PKE44_13260, partial [Plasticicumulans sp.]|uniref:hypothetical protein n=1 Tax=Plasticicumulans sp. TaxID=2307179 RepID=UPI002C6816DF